ncbi:MAG: hypothetical protein AAFQ84_08990, partial [Pseudomonadota bacterium]
RFPDRGLTNVCDELLQISEEHVERLEEVRRPRIGLRIAIAIVLIIGVVAIGFGVIQKFRLLAANPDELYSFEGVEALVNMVILFVAGLYLLLNAESRLKRNKALENLHQLRSIAHVIDMHQLTKDPTAILRSGRTASSPDRDLSPYQLMRYLDYCTEMLSLTGKLAALYMQDIRDAVVIQAVNEIEDLTSGLSNKIWQKLQILHNVVDLNEADRQPVGGTVMPMPKAGHPSN